MSTIRGFTDITGIWLGVVEIKAGLLGMVTSMVGVVGLYPLLNDRAPRMPRGGVWTFMAAVVGLILAKR